MREFSEAEKQLMVGIKSLVLRGNPPSRSELDEFGDRFFDDDRLDWTDAYSSLEAGGFLHKDSGRYTLSHDTSLIAAEIRRKMMSSGFDEWILRSYESKTYSHYCELVHGMDLCQCSMIDNEQLDRLIEVLGLTSANRVLDLGCGIGMITEYLSDITGATIVGVDFADAVIDMANRRTEMKRDRIAFSVCDMNQLDFPPSSFDTIIAIDTLYFADDMNATVSAMKRLIGDAGQMGLFYSQMIKPDDQKTLLEMDSTKLADALHKNKLTYEAWCFTENEADIWHKEREVAEQLKDDFENEGYADLYQSRIKEATRVLERVNEGRTSRYLYHVKRAR